MTDVIDHLCQKATVQGADQYKQHWDRIYEDFKQTGTLPAPLLTELSGAKKDREAIRNLLPRIAKDIAALQKQQK